MIRTLAPGLLGCGISRGPVRDPELGDLRPVLTLCFGLLLVFEKLGESEIEDLYLACRGNHYVSGLDITMDNILGVSVCKGVRDLDRNRKSAFQLQRPPINKLTHIF